MENEKPLIYQFRTLDNYYVYDTNKNAILNVGKKAYDFLLNNNEKLDRDDTRLKSENLNEIIMMLDNGFLSSKRIKKIEHPATNFLKDILDNKLQTITLQVTQQCNLRCKYCAYSGSYINRRHSDKVMDIGMAKKGIDFLLMHSQNSKVINIGFYGGEPLLEFNLVEECIDYAVEKAEGKKVTFNITTNATLLTKEKIAFLEKNDVDLMISLDGPKEIHDRNRRFASSDKGTFDVIVKKMEMIKECFPEFYKKVHFNAVVDPRIDFTCLNEFFSDYELLKDSFINTNFIALENLDISEEKNAELLDIKYRNKYDYEIFKMLLSKLGRVSEKNVSKMALANFEAIKANLYSMRNILRELPDVLHHGGVCIPGGRKLFLNIEGNLYPCEKCSETSDDMKIGSIYEGFDYKKVERLLNIGKLTEKQCKNCWATRLCSICAVSIEENNELSVKKKCEKCQDVKFNTHDMLVKYCMLKEFGYEFDEFANIISFKEVNA